METCRCEEYTEAVKKYTVETIGTLPAYVERLPAPEGTCIVWMKKKTSHHDYNFFLPVLTEHIPRSSCAEKVKEYTSPIEEKWIPVLPGLISQRLVNESKGLKDRPF